MKLILENWRKFLKEETEGCSDEPDCACITAAEVNTKTFTIKILSDLLVRYFRDKSPAKGAAFKGSSACDDNLKKAIRDFQTAAGIKCDACVGDETMAALRTKLPDHKHFSSGKAKKYLIARSQKDSQSVTARRQLAKKQKGDDALERAKTEAKWPGIENTTDKYIETILNSSVPRLVGEVGLPSALKMIKAIIYTESGGNKEAQSAYNRRAWKEGSRLSQRVQDIANNTATDFLGRTPPKWLRDECSRWVEEARDRKGERVPLTRDLGLMQLNPIYFFLGEPNADHRADYEDPGKNIELGAKVFEKHYFRYAQGKGKAGLRLAFTAYNYPLAASKGIDTASGYGKNVIMLYYVLGGQVDGYPQTRPKGGMTVGQDGKVFSVQRAVPSR